MEPKKCKKTKAVGGLMFVFEGEQYGNSPILDTQVTCMGSTVCWITWEGIDRFVEELESTITKYRI